MNSKKLLFLVLYSPYRGSESLPVLFPQDQTAEFGKSFETP